MFDQFKYTYGHVDHFTLHLCYSNVLQNTHVQCHNKKVYTKCVLIEFSTVSLYVLFNRNSLFKNAVIIMSVKKREFNGVHNPYVDYHLKLHPQAYGSDHQNDQQ